MKKIAVILVFVLLMLAFPAIASAPKQGYWDTEMVSMDFDIQTLDIKRLKNGNIALRLMADGHGLLEDDSTLTIEQRFDLLLSRRGSVRGRTVGQLQFADPGFPFPMGFRGRVSGYIIDGPVIYLKVAASGKYGGKVEMDLSGTSNLGEIDRLQGSGLIRMVEKAL